MAASDIKKRKKRRAMEHVHRVQAILRRWDPIGVLPGEFAPADEYDGYAPHIVSMVIQGCSVEELAAHLSELREGMVVLEAGPERDKVIATEIVKVLRENGI